MNKLRIFCLVVKHKSITAAAASLYRTQSAISQQIAALEGHLGAKLFDRRAKELLLTQLGEQLYALIGDPFTQIEDSLDQLLHQGKECKGEVRIGLLQDHSCEYPFFSILAEFSKQYPHVNPRVLFDTSEGIEQALLENHLDVGLLINFREKELFERQEIASAEHLLVGLPRCKKTPLFEQPLIDLDSDFTCLAAWIKKYQPESLATLRQRAPSMIAPNHLALKQIVLSGCGVAVLPRYLIANELAQGVLVPLDRKGKSLRVGLDLARRLSARPTAAQKAFYDFISNGQA